MVYVTFLISVSVFILTWLFLQTVVVKRGSLSRRVRQFTNEVAPSSGSGNGKRSLFREAVEDAPGALQRLHRRSMRGRHRSKKEGGPQAVGQPGRPTQPAAAKAKPAAKRQSFLATLEVMLRRADIKLPARDFAVRWVALVGIVTALSLMSPIARVGVLLVPLSFVGTALYLRMRMQRRLNQFNDGLHDMLIMVANALRAGHSFVQAMHLVVEESVGPMHDEFQRAEAEMQVGVVLEEALNRTAERVGSEDFDLIVTAIAIQRQIGGNLAEVLGRIAETIGERIKLKREIKALTSQGRLSAAIFMGLPAAVAILLYIINPSYMVVLFQTTLGLVLIVVALLGQTVGYMVIRKIVNVQL